MSISMTETIKRLRQKYTMAIKWYNPGLPDASFSMTEFNSEFIALAPDLLARLEYCETVMKRISGKSCITCGKYSEIYVVECRIKKETSVLYPCDDFRPIAGWKEDGADEVS